MNMEERAMRDTVDSDDRDAEAAILRFVARTAPAELAGDLNADTPLLSAGLLDSLGIVELMTFVSDELGFEISDDDFTPENFETVGSLVRLIAAKRRA
jgi:acyl carrier protein